MLRLSPVYRFAAFGEACPSYTTIVKGNFTSAFKTFKNVVTQEPDGFVKLLFSDGSDWFERADANLHPNGQWSIYCHKYHTISSHDAKKEKNQQEALKIVREKRRKLFQDFAHARDSGMPVILYRSQHNHISFDSTFKIYHAIEELNRRGSRFTLVLSQGGDGPHIPLLRELFQDRFGNFKVPTWDFVKAEYNQVEFEHYNKCSVELVRKCHAKLAGLK